MKYLKYIIILLTLCSFGGAINHFEITRYLDVISMLSCIILIVKQNTPIKPSLLGIIIAVWTFILFSAIVTHSDFSFYIGFMLHVLLAMFIIMGFNYNYKEINIYIYKCTRLVCYLGIINFFLYTFAPSLFSFVSSPTGYELNTIFYVFNYLPGDDFIIHRNQGIFWEPGVFQVVLNIHIYQVLVEQKGNFKKAILPSLLIVSTQSTTGLILMSIIYLYWLVSIRKVTFSISTVLLLLIFAFFGLFIVWDNIQEKFVGEGSGSAAFRAYDFYMGLNVIKDEPLVGIGMDPEHYLKRTTYVDMGFYDTIDAQMNRGNTNTFINVMMMFGIPFGLLFFIALYKQNIFEKKVFVFFIFFVALLSEPLFGMVFLFLLCLSSVSYSSPKHLKIQSHYV